MIVTEWGLFVLITAYCITDCTVQTQTTDETPPVFTEENRPCGGVLNEARGYLQTPGFPDKFAVPIKCKWIIDASLQPFNSTIVVYLTQLFVTTGLRFTESLFYDPELSYSLGEKFGEKLLHSVTEKNCRSTSWLRTDAKFLIVDFELDQLEGNHLRSLGGLLDVYGFNITYEARSDSSDPVREPTCSVVDCSYEGHCYAADNFTEFYCDCFSGFEGNDCSQGPLCSLENNMCMNNSTCRHLGATTTYCSCPPGYKGSRCDVVSSIKHILPDCKISNTETCTPQCSYKLNQAPCSCPQGFSKAPTDRMRYQNTMKLGGSVGGRGELPKIHPNRTFTAQFERQVFKYLRNKIPKIDGLRVINITLEGEITFHFFANKRDGRKVKDALNELVEKRHLGNITFAPSKITLRQNPTLLIKEIRINQRKAAVRCGDDFILSCTALGSPHMSFRWYKDGMVVNETIALRNIWTKQMKTDMNDQYMSLLSVKNADALDEGRYTCQVTDWGVEQCKTIDLEVIPPPDVKVMPMTITVEKGSSLNIVCMWPVGVDDRGQIYGYSWLKETKESKDVNLFKMQKNVEEWEDLYPAGSILKVFSIQKSTKYTCQVQSNAGSVNASIEVEILNKTAVPWCEADNTNAHKMHWTETRVWGVAKVECPPHYRGIVKRMCSLIYTGQATWQTPDFSGCISNKLIRISNQFQSLMLGFQNTTTVEMLANVLELLKARRELYPGEGEPVLSLMQNITWYLNVTSAWNDLVEATPLFYSIINTLLQFDNAIINSQKVVDLQKLVNQWTIFWTSHIEPEFSPTLIFDSLIVDVFTFDSSSVQSGIIFYLPRNTHVSYPSWFKESLAVIIDSGNKMLDNGTVCVAVVVYRDIMKYLPVRQIFKKDFCDAGTAASWSTRWLQT
ncbi:uncharacterized protein LOC111052935 isoform X2 [Nilaparvata lugens]|uniref:uncharacterized protein LOC111052935 isoform X2 n=1 Tax=Nilaparvata lugens TaxID=108931 RepID=UPI00193D82EF|nr:uncharacterized protein LOC111052935 isoform X2 [Nilaparvata lugens]